MADTTATGPVEAPPAQMASHPGDVRPLVARPSGNTGLWIGGAVLLAIGGGIFYGLQIRRSDIAGPSAIVPQQTADATISSPPPLVIPPMPQMEQDAWPGGAYGIQPGMAVAPVAPAPQQPAMAREPGRWSPPVETGPAPGPDIGAPSARAAPGHAYLSPTPSPSLPDTGGRDGGKTTEVNRVLAGQLENRSDTVPQGSVIQAVMETALDSTRAGFARAVVSRDVSGFDGTRVLIPRGSRLFGEYKADVSLGQKRALIQWKRLTRPDGTIIALDSPSADPLGRAGVKGKVNTHFFERFAGTILQSVLDLGVRAATSEATGDTVVIGAASGVTQGAIAQQPGEIKPTLKVRQGASIAVFVARDLDFSTVD